MTAVSVAGIEGDRFCFEGFLPQKGKERQERLEQVQNEPRLLVFYEAPHRLRQTLEDLETVLGGDRPVTLGRELTKRFEEIWRGTLQGAIAYYQDHDPKGEYTLVIAGDSAPSRQLSEAALKSELQALMQQGHSRSQASRLLAQSTPSRVVTSINWP